jgi:hypothetical protein
MHVQHFIQIKAKSTSNIQTNFNGELLKLIAFMANWLKAKVL